MPTLFRGLNIDSVVNFPVYNYWFCRLTDLSGNLVSGGGLFTHLWRACDPPVVGSCPAGSWPAGSCPGGLVAGGLVSYTPPVCTPIQYTVCRPHASYLKRHFDRFSCFFQGSRLCPTHRHRPHDVAASTAIAGITHYLQCWRRGLKSWHGDIECVFMFMHKLNTLLPLLVCWYTSRMGERGVKGGTSLYSFNVHDRWWWKVRTFG